MWFAQTAEPTLLDSTEPINAVVITNTTVETNGLLGVAVGVWITVYLIAVVLLLVASWQMFVKAGEPGWKALIPFYSTYTLFRIAGRNGWGFLLMFVPLVNFVVWVIVSLDLAKHFGKSLVFAIFGLILFPWVGYLMLGYGKSEYLGPKHS